jgi:hypothetical protein
LNGARGCGLTYKAGGISQETALISTYMDPFYKAEPDPNQRMTAYSIWYPSRPGILQSHKELPEGSSVKSQLKFSWLVEVGRTLEKATSYNHFVVSIFLEHESRRIVEEDLKFLMENWQPEIS